MHIIDNQNVNKNNFVSGLLYALSACFFWGLVFVIPQFLNQCKDIEIVLGRYFVFGVYSLLAAVFCYPGFFKKFSFKIWKTGFIWGVLTNPIYYFGIVIGVRYAGHPITIVTSGLTPIIILIYSNFKSKEISHSIVAVISVIIMSGVLLTNCSILDQPLVSESFWKSVLGMGCVIISTSIWTLYVIKNRTFLEKYPELEASAWSYILGIMTLSVSILGIIFCSIFKIINIKNLVSFSTGNGSYYLSGIITLGILSSSLANLHWNKASARLSSSLLGALLIFESFFGLLMSFLVTFQLPTFVEIIGIILMFGGSLFGLTLFGRASLKKKENLLPVENKSTLN